MVHHGFGTGKTSSNAATPEENRLIAKQISAVDGVNRVHFVVHKSGEGPDHDIIFEFDSHPPERPLKDIIADIEKASVIQTNQGEKRIHHIDIYIIQYSYPP